MWLCLLLLLLPQERLVSRAGALLRLLRWVNSQQPDLLDSGVVQQVEALAAADDINPAVQVLL
jgi:nitrous oxidase accessory protein NosD